MQKAFVTLICLGCVLFLSAQRTPEEMRADSIIRRASKLEFYNPAAALIIYDSALFAPRRRTIIYTGKLNCYLRLKDFASAEKQAEQLVEMHGMPENREWLAFIYLKNGKEEKANEQFTLAIDSLETRIAHPEDYLIYAFGYGRKKVQLKDKIEYNLAINSVNRARYMMMTGKKEEAQAAMVELAKAYPNHFLVKEHRNDDRDSLIRKAYKYW